MSSLNQAHIVVGITGGIAAYKTIELIRLLTKAGAEVQVVLTDGAKAFVTEMTLQAISGKPVRSTLLDPQAELGMGHIELAKWADLVVIAPASADFIARHANGLANDLLSTLCLATTALLLLAPAMNQAMWQHPATQSNINLLQQREVNFVGPDAGAQACGDVGPGRMSEPDTIFQAIEDLLTPKTHHLEGQHWVITAGPTQEAIDPVRYISNHSSGKMGYAIAAAAAQHGATVTLISGPVALPVPAGVKRVSVKSAQEMLYACRVACANNADVFIGAAAVADFRMKEVANQKMKKQQDSNELQLTLVKNPDIIATLAQEGAAKCMVGFAAETQDVVGYAKDKLQRKGLDLIIANDVSQAGIGFNSDQNQVTIISASDQWTSEQASKSTIAQRIIEHIHQFQLTQSTKD
ncbi:bifunctional phosphopantothenoylcysteine decarboxylase/phosphopantothenate--cysteine ligase CoaBC [Maribrevibacterium harenarium]|uniref:Coenzyme A biosynthesis bifunctional protein CoaBC n=1 Tax=Maribrevibacterium harenarium TaxID=2589817 RepID=A0A501WN90_9GAMM|nr:bifunctional phosphopantothenoylcysteine decarboxylase/phosphopantothenate--cysteine ligase CoaBC [Maribrevibacterium harenarium]TPE49810.1 bifunctional phosphopantothenoylcysteine decarboxylase/phosphopantothenate--cysteine ligase CoaBC [Maribrevibacterium harenarium]